MHNNISINSILYDDKFNIVLSKKEINTNLNKMFELYKDEFIEYQDIYKAIAVRKYCKIYNIWDNTTYETYSNYLRLLSPTILDLRIKDSTFQFQWLYNYKNINNSFVSTNFYDILYISLKNLLSISKNIKILKCKNCNKYFIPDTNHNTKYCNFLFSKNKTCKEIGANNYYSKKLEEDILLKKYRKRYQSLAKQASTTNHNSKSNKVFEYYKKEGKKVKQNYINGIITAEQFENWINCTKIRK